MLEHLLFGATGLCYIFKSLFPRDYHTHTHTHTFIRGTKTRKFQNTLKRDLLKIQHPKTEYSCLRNVMTVCYEKYWMVRHPACLPAPGWAALSFRINRLNPTVPFFILCFCTAASPCISTYYFYGYSILSFELMLKGLSAVLSCCYVCSIIVIATLGKRSFYYYYYCLSVV